MKLFVTGSTGFIGRSVVPEAVDRGHDVVALARPASDDAHVRTIRNAGASVVRGDLRDFDAWPSALVGVDAVIHLAANFGSFAEQFAATVVGTEQLINAMEQHAVPRLVVVSTFSVYDFVALKPGAVLNENSPLETRPSRRDDYTVTKLEQERVAVERGASIPAVTVVRPGAVFGRGHLWNGGHAMTFGDRLGVVIGPTGSLKLTYVENCAEAIVRAAEIGGDVYNIVDQHVAPREFRRALRANGIPVPRSIPIPYGAAWVGARLIGLVNSRFLSGRLRLPELADSARMDARYKPLRCSNNRAMAELGWRPRYSLDQAVRRIVAEPGAPAAVDDRGAATIPEG